MYRRFFRPLLFSCDPERAHERVITLMSLPGAKALCSRYAVTDPGQSFAAFGLNFPNPLGLAAGLDKNAAAVPALAALGFGSIEIGTVTPEPQSGNPRPRIFRLPDDSALINRMGFPSDGVERVAARLERLQDRKRGYVLGANIGKNKSTPLERAADDYVRCVKRLGKLVDYIAINVSSPNTPDLRQLQRREPLERLILAVQAANSARLPILVKLAPDLSSEDLNDAVEAAVAGKVAGIIATNTTLARPESLQWKGREDGGLSGRPLLARSVQVVTELCALLRGRLPVVGCGGITTADDALAFRRAGAVAVQLYTGLIYQGPSLPGEIVGGLKGRW